MSFGGKTFDPDLDGPRLSSQLERVRSLMLDGKERTLIEIADATNVPLSSVSSRIRDLKKKDFGSYNVISRRVSKGTWIYYIPQAPKFDVLPGGQLSWSM